MCESCHPNVRREEGNVLRITTVGEIPWEGLYVDVYNIHAVCVLEMCTGDIAMCVYWRCSYVCVLEM